MNINYKLKSPPLSLSFSSSNHFAKRLRFRVFINFKLITLMNIDRYLTYLLNTNFCNVSLDSIIIAYLLNIQNLYFTNNLMQYFVPFNGYIFIIIYTRGREWIKLLEK